MNYHNELTMSGPTYSQITKALDLTPKPKPGKQRHYDEEFGQYAEEISALLLLIEKELQQAFNKGNEAAEPTPDLFMALDRLNTLEKIFASNPKTQHLACLLRGKIEEIKATFSHQPDENKEAKKEEAETKESGLSLIIATPKPFSIVPEKTPSDTSVKKEEKKEEVHEALAQKNASKEEEGELEQDKGPVAPYAAF